MNNSHKRRTRKLRRGQKARLKYGRSAAPRHNRIKGRTGNIFSKELRSRQG